MLIPINFEFYIFILILKIKLVFFRKIKFKKYERKTKNINMLLYFLLAVFCVNIVYDFKPKFRSCYIP